MPKLKDRVIVPRRLKGMRDINPNLNQLRYEIIRKASEVYKSYGFEHWDTPLIEYAEVIGKYLPSEDNDSEGTVADGVYSFRNPEPEPTFDSSGIEKRDKWDRVIMENQFVALRYDLTAPLARLYSDQLWQDKLKGILKENKMPLFRRFQYGPVFRFEPKLDPGRFREFWQLDFDSVGTSKAISDAEVCMVLSDAMEAIGLERSTYTVKVNNRKILKGFLKSVGITDELNEQNILRVIDKIDKISMMGVEDELGEGRVDNSGSFIKGLKLDSEVIYKIINFYEGFNISENRGLTISRLESQNINNNTYRDGLSELSKISLLLDEANYDEKRIILSPTLVRGMAYYTGPVFEVESSLTYFDNQNRERKVGAICGGGRYDDLVNRLLGIKVPATGASIGVDRLAELLQLTNKVNSHINGPVLIINFDENLMGQYLSIATELRRENIATEIYVGMQNGLNKQLAYADKKNSPIALLLGEDEFKKGVISLRDLQYGKEIANKFSDKKEWLSKAQIEVKREDIVKRVKEHLKNLNSTL